MAVRTTWNNAVEGQPDYDEQDLRNLVNAFVSSGDATSSTKLRGGVLRTGLGDDLRVSTNGTYQFTVRVGRAVIPATAGGEGAFTAYHDTETSYPIEQVADSTYSRLDSVYIRAFSPALGDSVTGGAIGIAYGNPASVPTAPAVPDNSIRLAILRVPAAGGSVTVETDTRKWLVSPGGTYVASSEAQLTSFRAEATVGTLAVLTNPYRLYVRGAADWQLLVDASTTQWQNLQIAANYTYQTEIPQVKKIGEYVSLRGNFRRTSGNIALNGGNSLITIPSALASYRPSNRRMFICAAAGANSTTAAYGRVLAIVQPDGGIQFQGINTGTDWASWIDLSAIGYYI